MQWSKFSGGLPLAVVIAFSVFFGLVATPRPWVLPLAPWQAQSLPKTVSVLPGQSLVVLPMLELRDAPANMTVVASLSAAGQTLCVLELDAQTTSRPCCHAGKNLDDALGVDGPFELTVSKKGNAPASGNVSVWVWIFQQYSMAPLTWSADLPVENGLPRYCTAANCTTFAYRDSGSDDEANEGWAFRRVSGTANNTCGSVMPNVTRSDYVQDRSIKAGTFWLQYGAMSKRLLPRSRHLNYSYVLVGLSVALYLSTLGFHLRNKAKEKKKQEGLKQGNTGSTGSKYPVANLVTPLRNLPTLGSIFTAMTIFFAWLCVEWPQQTMWVRNSMLSTGMVIVGAYTSAGTVVEGGLQSPRLLWAGTLVHIVGTVGGFLCMDAVIGFWVTDMPVVWGFELMVEFAWLMMLGPACNIMLLVHIQFVRFIAPELPLVSGVSHVVLQVQGKEEADVSTHTNTNGRTVVVLDARGREKKETATGPVHWIVAGLDVVELVLLGTLGSGVDVASFGAFAGILVVVKLVVLVLIGFMDSETCNARFGVHGGTVNMKSVVALGLCGVLPVTAVWDWIEMLRGSNWSVMHPDQTTFHVYHTYHVFHIAKGALGTSAAFWFAAGHWGAGIVFLVIYVAVAIAGVAYARLTLLWMTFSHDAPAEVPQQQMAALVLFSILLDTPVYCVRASVVLGMYMPIVVLVLFVMLASTAGDGGCNGGDDGCQHALEYYLTFPEEKMAWVADIPMSLQRIQPATDAES